MLNYNSAVLSKELSNGGPVRGPKKTVVSATKCQNLSVTWRIKTANCKMLIGFSIELGLLLEF